MPRHCFNHFPPDCDMNSFQHHCVLPEELQLFEIVIVITFYSPNCLGQETAKGPFGLRVKLPPAHLCTTHGGSFTLSLLIAERQAGKLWIPIFIVFGLTQPGIEPESTASVADALSTRTLIGGVRRRLERGSSESESKIMLSDNSDSYSSLKEESESSSGLYKSSNSDSLSSHSETSS